MRSVFSTLVLTVFIVCAVVGTALADDYRPVLSTPAQVLYWNLNHDNDSAGVLLTMVNDKTCDTLLMFVVAKSNSSGHKSLAAIQVAKKPIGGVWENNVYTVTHWEFFPTTDKQVGPFTRPEWWIPRGYAVTYFVDYLRIPEPVLKELS
ncbi:hypothetical protein KKF61_06255 [Patescibacteria group bacterium]|nr:hypothetical protein [Patescibacteria group bacterium]